MFQRFAITAATNAAAAVLLLVSVQLMAPWSPGGFSVDAAPEADRVVDLPGWGTPPTPHYSGYLDASKSDGCTAELNGPICKIHYWLAMAEEEEEEDDDDEEDDDHDHDHDHDSTKTKPKKTKTPKPTVLWLNGGPGSSSLLGFLQEVGPLLLNATGGLMENPWSWTKAGANLVAIEAPVGVGFSYCSKQLDGGGGPCENTDTFTAQASRAALVDFFGSKFPELADGGFYIAGESYAGVYIPTLARELLTHPDGKRGVPLRGLMVGDPCTDNDAQSDSMDPMWYSQKYGLMDDEVFDVLRSDECSGYRSGTALGMMTRRPRRRDAANPGETGTFSSKFSHRSVGKRWSSRVAASDLNQELARIEDLDQRRLRAEELYAERVLGIAGESKEINKGEGENENDRANHNLRSVASDDQYIDDDHDYDDDYDNDEKCKVAYRKFLISSSDHLSQGWHDMFLDDYSLFAPITTKEDEQMAEYFNRDDVRKALHVTETPDDPWPSPKAGFSYQKEYDACNWRDDIRFPNTSMVDIYRDVLPLLDRVWIYNGDTDPCVSYEGTREAVKQILSPELDGGSYRPWFYRQEAATLDLLAEKAVLFGPDLIVQTLDRAQFAGEVTSYEGGLSFVTFHGSGHMVPQFRPQSSLHFLERFLHAPADKPGEELTPLLPSNSTLASLSDDDFETAMDLWTESARHAADEH